jgi:molybdate transport system substrate-binding protein
MKRLRWQAILGILVYTAAVVAIALTWPQRAAAAPKRTLQVFAASVLTEAFSEMERAFERANPDVDVTISFGATSMLRTQVEHGATPDVFESADEKNIRALVQSGYIVGGYAPIAHNRITLIVPLKNPAHIRSLADVARPGVSLVGCNPEVPVGAYTEQVVAKLGQSGKFGADYAKRVKANFRSLEPNVKGIVAKVITGDADAGFCYVSDVNENVRKQVKVIPIPSQYNVLASHFIGVVKGAHEPQMSKRFIAAVLSPAGQGILKRHGMIPVKGE